MTAMEIARPYWAIFSARCRVLLQYRAAALAGCATQVFWGLIRMMIFAAFYEVASGSHPMSYEDVRSYVWLGQAMLLLVMFGADWEIAEMIRKGTIAFELARPLGLYRHWYARAVATRTASLLLRMPPILLIAWLFFGLELPGSLQALAMWIAATAAAVFLSSAISMLLTVSLLWTISGEGINRLAPALLFLFSGIIVPLPLLPEWLQPVVKVLPFRGLADTPYRIWLGHLDGQQALLAVGQQLVWVVMLMALGAWMLQSATRRVVIQGG